MVIRCRHKLTVLAMCIPLCRQPLRKLVDSIPPPPNWLGWYGDRACCAPRREIGRVRHAPINAAGPATPAFVSAALDWRNRHQSPALVIDHLGDLRRRIVIPDVVSSQERGRGYPDPIRDAPVILRRYATSGRGSSLPIEPTFVGGAACAPAAINPAERRVVFRQRVECGSDQGLVRSEPCRPHENGLCLRGRRQLWRDSGGHDALARRARDISGYGRGLQRRRLERRLLCGGSNAGRRSAARNHLARITSA